MLWKCLIKYKGTNEYVEEIQYSNGPLHLDASKIESSMTQIFRYKTDRPSSIFTSIVDGKKYLVPAWLEVHPEATYNDIDYIKPKKHSEPPQTFKIKDYTIKYNPNKKVYICNCQGYFRVKDKSIGCKHIQELKNKKYA